MITERTDPELGLHLTTLRALQWIFSSQGDPYALVLRAEGDDPDALRRRVRQRGPLHRSRSGAWVTGSHRLGVQLLADPRLDARHHGADGPQEHPIRDGVWDRPMCHVLPLEGAGLNLARSDYARLAALTGPALAPALLDRYRAESDRAAHRLLDRLGPGFDLVTEFARPVAVAGLGALLGLPAERHGELAELCAALGPALDATLCPPQLRVARELEQAVRAGRDLLAQLVDARRRDPGDDLLSALLAAAEGDGATSIAGRPGTTATAERDGATAAVEADVVTVGLLAMAVGVEVTTNLVGGAVGALLRHPDQWELVRAEARWATAAVEEALRFDPPVRLVALLAREEFELAGQPVAADSQVVLLVDAANRDPEAYRDPDAFDLRRFESRRSGPAPTAQPDHLSLTPGSPAGLVGPLVRAGAGTALRALVAGRPGLRPAGEPLRRLRSPVLHAPLRFPVTSG